MLISHNTQLWSWNWIHRQQAHESNFPTVCLPNGNAVKFSHTNGKHFTVGDPMVFPIVKMGNKNPPKSPLPLARRGPHLIQQCLGPPHAPPQTAAPTVEALSQTYMYVSKVPIGYNGAPQIRPQKHPFPWTDLQIPLPASFLDPSDLWCQTASGSDRPVFHNALDRPTHRRTDRQIVHGIVDHYRPLRL